jgi:WD40 repeat protein
MSRDAWSGYRNHGFREAASSSSSARRPVRLSVLSVLQAGILLAVITAFAAWAVEPAAPDGESPLWTIPTGQAIGVKAAAFSPDGRRLATGGKDGCVVVWELGKGVERALPRNGHGMVISLAFSPDGTTLAAGDQSFEVVLWDATTGKERATLRGHTDVVSDLDFSPDGAALATASLDRTIRIWNVASARLEATMSGHSSGVCSVRFSPDGQTLASGSNAGVVKLWDAPSGQCRGSLGPNRTGHSVECLAFSRDGSTLAFGSVMDPLSICDVATGREQMRGRTEVYGTRQVAFSADDRTLMGVRYDGNMKISDRSSRCERTISLGNRQPICSALSPDGLLLALGELDGTVRVWDVNRIVRAHFDPSARER